MGPNGAPIAVVTRADVYRHHTDCLKTDLFSTSKAAPGAVGRPRLGESDVVSTIGASRTIPVVDPTHWEATRATFRSRLFHRRRSPCTTRIIEMLGSIQRTRLRSHPTALCGCLSLYVGMRGPARQPQPTNWCHGLPDGKGHGRPSAMDRAWLDLGPTLMILGLMSAGGPHFFALAVPGNHSVGPYDPVGAPYGRRGHGRLRRPTHAYPRDGKRVNGPFFFLMARFGAVNTDSRHGRYEVKGLR